jgi:hypothetical protein
MCKVTIKAVEKFLKGASGERDGKAWELHVFKCRVSVDGSEEEATRTCKTFDAGIAQKIKAMPEGHVLTFEAKKEGDCAPFDFMLVPERKQGFSHQHGRGGWTEPFGPTNRQCCLRVAVELERARSEVSGDVPTAKDIIATAEELLAWLEQGGAK